MKKNDAPGGAGTMIVAGVLGMLCCAAPLLVVLAAADLAGFFASTGRVLTAALVGLVAVVGYLALRRRTQQRPRSVEVEGLIATPDDGCEFCSPADEREETRP